MDIHYLKKNVAAMEGGALAGLVSTTLSFTGVTFFFNNNATSEGGGAILATVHTELLMSGYVVFRKNNCTAGYGGAISLTQNSRMIISDTVAFENNWAEMGGAVYFRDSSMILKQYSILVTRQNNAKYYGGALFHMDSINYYQCNFHLNTSYTMNTALMDMILILLPDCFLELENFRFNLNLKSSVYQIHSYNDSAGIDGQFIYGGLMDKCRVYDTHQRVAMADILYHLLLNSSTLHIESNNLKGNNVISSEAFTLCFCESDQEYDCTGIRSISVLKGGTFNVSVLALSQGNTITAPVILAKISKTARLGLNQSSRHLTSSCTYVSYNIYSTQTIEVLQLYPNATCRDQGLAVAVIEIYFKPCPYGFIDRSDNCDCEERLLHYNAECYMSFKGYYIKVHQFWVKAYFSNESDNSSYRGLILYKSCPIDYCKNGEVDIFIEDPDVQCDYNHSGILCGACAKNFSIIFGNPECKICSNINLYLIAVFAAAGILLIFFLSVLRLTVATGMINSIILYANIVQANKTVFFPHAGNNVLTVFIAWMNLDLGFPTCFYDGMDAYVQTWLQFVFPIYIWFLICLIIITSRYSKFMTRIQPNSCSSDTAADVLC